MGDRCSARRSCPPVPESVGNLLPGCHHLMAGLGETTLVETLTTALETLTSGPAPGPWPGPTRARRSPLSLLAS